MDIDIYREFTALATHRSFVSAARDLNMSQPSLSRHMTAFARELGCQLFYETRPLSLTAAGEVVLKYAGKIIRDQENMLAELNKLPARSESRILIIDLFPTNALYVGINETAALAKQQFPGLRVEFINMDSSGMNARQMVEMGKIDISIETTISSSQEPLEPNVSDKLQTIWIPEFHGELVVGIAKESPLASRPDLQLTDLAQSRFILQANRHSERFREDFVNICTERGFYPNITLVPTDSQLEFYGSHPADGIHLLTKVDRKYNPLISSLLKEHVRIRTLKDDCWVNSYALMSSCPDKPELRFFAEHLRQHADRMRNEMQ
ncbi:hypothetical protein B5F40_09605 [Gordonibacter sp. An230]|uniref:LysR family transcriptional regulator n=1 Tax=Gordonibacter sp. An230 TaxID=1965592 RepID=UPI000B378311|nr:LysR family transcriptional regulator [Gordonibacter sp. An230]OUO89772.1 hypothetical protein B5F40_09605 [Gordonibacter sp. An230]